MKQNLNIIIEIIKIKINKNRKHNLYFVLPNEKLFYEDIFNDKTLNEKNETNIISNLYGEGLYKNNFSIVKSERTNTKKNGALNNYFLYETNLTKKLDELNLENDNISKKKSDFDIKDLGYDDRIKFKLLLRKNKLNSFLFYKRLGLK